MKEVHHEDAKQFLVRGSNTMVKLKNELLNERSNSTTMRTTPPHELCFASSW